MSCGRNLFIQEFFYLYNFQTGINDAEVDHWQQRMVEFEIRKNKKKYDCVSSSELN